jgi:CheY-like chemotaxis protein
MLKERNCQPILIVEDNDDDYEVAEHAFRGEKGIQNPIIRCETGDEAADYLFHKGVYARPNARDTPALVLLDLNLPRIDDWDVLMGVKSDRRLRNLPVVVMISSEAPTDVEECYSLGANTYIAKPLEWKNVFEAIIQLKQFWLEIAILPKVI